MSSTAAAMWKTCAEEAYCLDDIYIRGHMTAVQAPPQEHSSQAVSDPQLLTVMTAPKLASALCILHGASSAGQAHSTSGSPGAGSGADAPKGGLLGGRLGAWVGRGVRGANRPGSSGKVVLLEAFEATQGELVPAQAAMSMKESELPELPCGWDPVISCMLHAFAAWSGHRCGGGGRLTQGVRGEGEALEAGSSQAGGDRLRKPCKVHCLELRLLDMDRDNSRVDCRLHVVGQVALAARPGSAEGQACLRQAGDH